MKNINLIVVILLYMLLSTPLNAQDVSVFPKGEISNIDNHTGIVWLKELNQPDGIFTFSLAHATFAEGTGYYQERGKPIQIVHKGDVIKCLPDMEHWHGATPESSFAYIGVTPVQKGKTKWLKRVTDAEYGNTKSGTINNTTAEQEIIKLSKQKWDWMAEKNTDSLNALFDAKSVFVHMGGSWGKEQELNVIKSGGIHYKKADIHSVSVNIINNTAILLNNITLLAVVGGNEVTNPFIVTEVYIKINNKWMLGSLSFTKLLTPDDTKH